MNSIINIINFISSKIPENIDHQHEGSVDKLDEQTWEDLNHLYNTLTDINQYIKNIDNKDNYLIFIEYIFEISSKNLLMFLNNSDINRWVLWDCMQLSIRKQIEISLLLHNTLFVKNDCLDKRISKILKGKYKFTESEMENISKDYFEDGCIKNTKTEINLLCSNLALTTEKIHKIYDTSSNAIHNSGWFDNKKYINLLNELSPIQDKREYYNVCGSIYRMPWNLNTLQKLPPEILDQTGKSIIINLNQDRKDMILFQQIVTVNIVKFLKKINTKL